MRFLLLVVATAIGFAQSGWGAELRVVYDPAQNEDERWAQNLIRESGAISDVAAMLQTEFAELKPLALRVGGDDGPYYDPDFGIQIPYGFVLEVRRMLRSAEYVDDEERLEQVVVDVFLHTVLHEIGHYLVDTLGLPITGREEDAVDELAYLLLIDVLEDGAEFALSAADFFLLEDEAGGDFEESDFWGEHSLDIQRFHAGICIIHGSDPEEYGDLGADLGLSEDRLAMCEEDYPRRRDAWRALLEPHLAHESPLMTGD